MKLATHLRLAWNILVHSKLRSWLTVLGIVIGVAAVILIVSIGDGAKASISESLGQFGTDIITISPGSDRATGAQSGFAAPYLARDSARSTKKNLTVRDAQLLDSMSEIKLVMGVISDRTTVEYRGESASVSIQGIDPMKWRSFSKIELEKGRFIQSSDLNGVVIGSRVAERVFKNKVGLGSQFEVNGVPMRVVGILKASTGFSNTQDNSLYMTVKAGRNVLNKESSDDFSQIQVLPYPVANFTPVVEKMEQRLMDLRGESKLTKTFSVISFQSAQDRINETITAMTMFLAAIALVALIVGAIGIANTMFTSVLEKTRDIGIMKAIGATNSDVLLIFLLNAGMIGIVGGLIGIGIGAGIAYLFSSLNIAFGPPGTGTTLKAIVTPTLVIGMLLFSMLIGILSGLIPAYRAANQRPAQALKYE
ncbi:MAG: ABC transporter permease [Candidatus Micrarchaeota archaeon]